MIHARISRWPARALCGGRGPLAFAWRLVTCEKCLTVEKIDLSDLDLVGSWTIYSGMVTKTVTEKRGC